jgi:apolipoprotein D and lipocalin family protein
MKTFRALMGYGAASYVVAVSLVVAPLALAEDAMAIKAVDKVELKRYVGKWHEIALLPNRFQAMCLTDTTAEYVLQPNGKIQVTNRCRNADGKQEEVIGAAKNAEGDTTNAKLKVRFAPAWLSFLPQVWGDYWVIELDPDYRYAVVSEPSRKFLWILSRTPKMKETTYQGVVERLKAKGYDTSKLKLTPQSEAKQSEAK